MFDFNRYLTTLQQLDVSESLVMPQSVVLLSGSSHYAHASLSQEQQQFLQVVQPAGYHIIPSNFPYNRQFDHQQTQFPSLLQASVSNIAYYRHTLWNTAFQKELCRHLRPLFALENIVLVTQSSGLNMFTQIMSQMPNNPTLKLIALGPVATKEMVPAPNHWIIKGQKDYYSRILDCHTPTHIVACGHHDYLVSPAVKEVLDDIIKN